MGRLSARPSVLQSLQEQSTRPLQNVSYTEGFWITRLLPQKRQNNIARNTLHVFSSEHVNCACKPQSTPALVTPPTPNPIRRLVQQAAPNRTCNFVGDVVALVAPLLLAVEDCLSAVLGEGGVEGGRIEGVF